MSDERLDRLIDEVAREMTESHPSSDFRARVIANLDRRPGRVWRPIWIVAPLGTLAVAVLVVLVTRPFSTASHRVQRATVDAPKREERVGGLGRDRGSAASAPRPGSQAVKTETAPAAPTPDTTYERSQRETRVAAAGRRQALSNGAAEVATLAPPPLVVPPLGVEAIGVDALPTGSIAVPQLDAIAPIEVAPLPADDGRPSGTSEGRIGDSRLPT
jgi:hypothetical protein